MKLSKKIALNANISISWSYIQFLYFLAAFSQEIPFLNITRRRIDFFSNLLVNASLWSLWSTQKGVWDLCLKLIDKGRFYPKFICLPLTKKQQHHCEKHRNFTWFPVVEILRKSTGELPETMRKLCLSAKFTHQEIRWEWRYFSQCKLIRCRSANISNV